MYQKLFSTIVEEVHPALPPVTKQKKAGGWGYHFVAVVAGTLVEVHPVVAYLYQAFFFIQHFCMDAIISKLLMWMYPYNTTYQYRT